MCGDGDGGWRGVGIDDQSEGDNGGGREEQPGGSIEAMRTGVEVAALCAVGVGLWYYDWRVALIAVGGLILAASTRRLW